MKKSYAFTVFRYWDKKGRYIFTRQDLSKVFYEDNPKALTEGLARLINDGFIIS